MIYQVILVCEKIEAFVVYAQVCIAHPAFGFYIAHDVYFYMFLVKFVKFLSPRYF